jgi:chromosome segregation ATPase
MYYPKLTSEEICAAAEELEAEAGAVPTLPQIRERLKRGSYTTIAAALTERSRKVGAASKAQQSLPEKLHQQMLACVNTLWGTAVQQAEQRFESARLEFERARDELQREVSQAGELADYATLELESANEETRSGLAENQRLHGEVGELQRHLSQAQHQCDLTAVRLIEVEKRAEALAEELGSVNMLNAQLVSALASCTAGET